MSFTRQHYAAIAQIIRDARTHSDAQVALDQIADDLADYLRLDNPQFNTDRFMQASGVQDDAD